MQAGPIGGTRLLEAATAKHAKSAHEIAVHHDVGEAVAVEIGDDRLRVGGSRTRCDSTLRSTRSSRRFAREGMRRNWLITAIAVLNTCRYLRRFAESGIPPSVRSVRDSYDNALAETLFGLLETEVIGRNGQWRTLDQAE